MIELKRQNKGKNPTTEDIDKLLEKYYEGLTNVEEESLLHAWLSQPGLPSRFDADKALFGYFDAQRNNAVKRSGILRFATIFSAAAAVLVLLLLTGNPFNGTGNKNNYVFIHGKKYTNLTLVKTNARSSITVLHTQQDDVSASASLLDEGNDVIQKQLNMLDDVEL